MFLKEYHKSFRQDMKEINYCLGKLNQVNREIDHIIRQKIAAKKSKNRI